MFNRFATRTSIHGFSEISEVKSLFWKQIWSVLVISAFGLTTFQIYRGIDQYINQSPVTEVAPAKPEEILYPPFTICYPHWMYWVDWKKAYSLNFSKSMILYALSFMVDIDSHIPFDLTEARQQLLQVMSDNKFYRLKQFYEKIARPFPMELRHSSKNDTSKLPLSTTIEVIDIRGNVVLCYRMQANEISKLAPDIRFEIYDLSYSYASEGLSETEYNYNIIQPLNLLFEYNVPLASIETIKNFTTAGLPWIFFPAGDMTYMEIGTDKPWYISLLSISANRIQSIKEKACVSGLRWNGRNITRQKEKCTATYHLKTCRCPKIAYAMLMGEDAIENICPKEIRFIFIDKNKEKTNYANTTIKICAENETAKLELNKCVQDIPIPCELWRYSFAQTESQLNPTFLSLGKNSTLLILWYPEPNDILISTETNIQTWESFIGNIGGVLGIWTGASVLSFFQLFYLLCTSVHSKQHTIEK